MTERAHSAVADTLPAIESIKQLKARYCRYLDTKDWAAWRTIFTDDFLSDTSEAGGAVIAGADDFVAFTRRALGRATQPTAHQVHNPEIELTSATTARGTWALQDVVRFGPGITLVGYGHYHETYENIDGQWFIKSIKLTRLREDIVTPLFSIYVSPRIRAAIGTIAGRLMDR
ncbi:nuclear transport factor 2 family protein [Mycobacterium avium]|uniref:nuclear transport factor 2 family protein n=1 Tax=Mycobacterium avium TaxID=1764 RepID=UPI0003922F5B|nr:nuclear transport factor 2 family protein [Mycobacterium avium]QXD08114.1 nuclear transport factor 2 family protein [Mycobacterium avium subsp. hominissuis]BAN31712.1 SnoaL-like polyketide cyclase [Mycobacterium avium subsp. hominissuis TH135]